MCHSDYAFHHAMIVTPRCFFFNFPFGSAQPYGSGESHIGSSVPTPKKKIPEHMCCGPAIWMCTQRLLLLLLQLYQSVLNTQSVAQSLRCDAMMGYRFRRKKYEWISARNSNNNNNNSSISTTSNKLATSIDGLTDWLTLTVYEDWGWW